MQMKKCNDDAPVDVAGNVEFNRLSSLLTRQTKTLRPKFMAALVVMKYNKFLLMCGTTIISEQWIITTAHCCKSVKDYPLVNVKVSSNSARWKFGIPHDVIDIVPHGNYTPKTITHNICLVKVRQPFTETHEIPVPIAGFTYKYVANSTALALGWNSQIDEATDDLYGIDVRLLQYDSCKKYFPNADIDRTMICGTSLQDSEGCSFDSGGPLFQDNVVIGVVSFETDCANGIYPRVYTRISYFEKWIRQIATFRRDKIDANFKH